MSYGSKRRFVAGAICPRCASLDKVVVYNEGGVDFRECVSCGFKEKSVFKPIPRELETRVNVTAQQKQAETQVLKFKTVKKTETPPKEK